MGAWSKSFAYYKTKYFGRRNKSSKARTSCEYLPIDTKFVSILLLVSVLFSQTFLVHTVKIKPIIKAKISGKLVTSGISDVATA